MREAAHGMAAFIQIAGEKHPSLARR
jgi:hypothetical protein